MKQYDVVIIGGGPAGLTAGIYACRAGLATCLIECMFPGGQIVTTHLLENYPGFPEGISGADFGMQLQQQAERLGLEIIYDEVTQLKLESKEKEIVTYSDTFSARTVILCMGAQPAKLGVDREDELMGSGVSYCATCDGAFYKDRPVAIVGGGDTALTEAVYLSKLASKVYLIHRRNEFRAAASLTQRADAEENIEFVLDSTVSGIEGENTVSALAVQNVKTDEQRQIPVDALFVAVGVLPRTELVKGIIALDEKGYIITDPFMRTNLPGVFAAGDIRNTPLRQVVTAAADGAIAATYANEYLMENA